ncbi:nitric oxide synthase 1 isoform X2 [Hydra vulgaris]|uniref:nitric oxide synthase 1 isoform X2 n=1 Tax=Hydra vulgaris TaxID=6087 RepID=UPI001F5E87DC|nr:nitric oxide synthase, brain isoform X2 [Hydra vulgaris]
MILCKTQKLDLLTGKKFQPKFKVAGCNEKRCVGSIVIPDEEKHIKIEPSQVKNEALKFLEEYFQTQQCLNTLQHKERIKEVLTEIDNCNSYELTEKELIFGARLAWRNASRCIGRIHWKNLHVFDCRHVTTAQQMFECCLQHLRFATNKGNIRSTISIFPHQRNNHGDFRIWNPQLVRYAGYKQDDGVIGDPSSIEITEVALSLGWVSKRTMFDILPLIIQAGSTEPQLFEIPKEYILEVNIQHPVYPQLDRLGLRWYAVPVISNMALSCGGLTFTAIPFNGWYMSTEISVRNFCDESRYNLLKPTAELLGYNTSTHMSLWKDRAVLELTAAVLHSYQAAGVTMVDHHSLAESFIKHLHKENKLRGGCPSDWVWIVPPLSGSICPVFHQEMLNYKLKPAYEYQADAWMSQLSTNNHKFKKNSNLVKLATNMTSHLVTKCQKITILYASETGRAESFAYNLQELLQNAFNSKVVCMDQYDFEDFKNENCIFVVASTTGNGEGPENGQAFGKKLYEMAYPSENMKTICGTNTSQHQHTSQFSLFDESFHILFSVFGLGSKAYPNFCAFAKSINNLLKTLGGKEIYPIGEGDELCGQEDAFKTWSQGCFKAACEKFSVKIENQSTHSFQLRSEDYHVIFPEIFIMKSLHEELKLFHQKAIEACRIVSVSNLQTEESNRVTNLVRIGNLSTKKLLYRPGDHLGVYACNNMEMVDRLISRVTNNKLTSLTVVDIVLDKEILYDEEVKNLFQKRLPFPNTLGRIFGWYLDITTPPTMKLLGIFASKCKNLKEKKMLMKLAMVSSEYENWKQSSYRTIVDVLEEFSSVEIDFILLATELPILKPRYYSVSSSPDLYPNEIHITVALVTYSINNVVHNGVCSSWLHSRKYEDEIYCFVRKAPAFNFPLSSSAPIIMVGTGTGIAPFRSFWQQRLFDLLHQSEVEFGEMFLFFGCRNKFDNIYGREIENAKCQGALTKVFVGCSRLPGNPKTYVQDLIKTNSEVVLKYFFKKQGHIYVCGNVAMASDVQKTIINIMMDNLKYTEQDCKDLIHNLKKNGRYHEDIFGATITKNHLLPVRSNHVTKQPLKSPYVKSNNKIIPNGKNNASTTKYFIKCLEDRIKNEAKLEIKCKKIVNVKF